MRLTFPRIPFLNPRLATATVGAAAPVLLDDEEYSERLIKWAWLAGMLYLISFMLPAVGGGQANNRPWQMAGWEMGYLAHMAVWNFAEGGSANVRRIRPLTESQAVCVAGAAVLSNWLLVSGCFLAYLGTRLGNPRRWGAYALRAAVYAALLGTSATLIWVIARNLTFMLGSILWCAAPIILAYGIWRMERQKA